MSQPGRVSSLSIILVLLSVLAARRWTSAPAAPSASALTREIGRAPLAGELLATRSGSGRAIILGFIAQPAAPGEPTDLPSLGEVLATGNPSQIPTIGALVPGPRGFRLVARPARHEPLPRSLRVAGRMPLVFADGASGSEGRKPPTHTVGLIPLLDRTGHAVAVLVATGRRIGAAPLPCVVEFRDDNQPLPAFRDATLL
jgi:hypothetical protein